MLPGCVCAGCVNGCFLYVSFHGSDEKGYLGMEELLLLITEMGGPGWVPVTGA